MKNLGSVIFGLCLMAKLMKVLFSSLKRFGALGLRPFWAWTVSITTVYLKHIS